MPARLVRRRALTRMALLAAAVSSALVFALVQVLHPVQTWAVALTAHAAFEVQAAVDDARWSCHFRAEPLVQLTGDSTVSMYARIDRRRAPGVGAVC